MLRVGADNWMVRHTVEGRGSGEEIVTALSEIGQDGFQFDSVTRLSATLDSGELAEVNRHAQEHGFYLEGGLPPISPLAPSPLLLAAGDGDLRAGIERHLHAIRTVVTGSTAVRAYLAEPWERPQAGAGWADIWQRTVAESHALLAAIAPLLRDLGLRIALENHGDATTTELIEFVESLDPELFGLCLDTGNLPLALESPLEGARRAAPYTFATHLKDAVVLADGGGDLVLQARPCGEGVLAIDDIVRVLLDGGASLTVLTVEDHDGRFPIPLTDAGFLEGFQSDGPVEQPAVEALVAASTQLIESGEAPGIDELEAISWHDQEADRSARTAAYVRRLQSRAVAA